MAERKQPTLADYVVTALSPALIMGLVGSLVFFLAELFYSGHYEGRLIWTLFFFVVGIVLVSRIAIEVDPSRARAYGLSLGVASFVALQSYVTYPKEVQAWAWFANIVLLSVVWWSADKLTWDCTYIDEEREASSKGLLAAAGFERSKEPPSEVVEEAPKKKKSTLWDRYQAFRTRRAKRPQTPGLSVIYFSLAALPIFGLGQSLIPSAEGARRSYTFWLAAVYVGTALGLLMTTSFLGLRRYLRTRNVEMPKAVVGVWLGLGAVVIILFLTVAALLPRPYSETPIWDMGRASSKDRNASKHAVLKDGSGKGDAPGGQEQQPGGDKATGKEGGPVKEGEGEGKDGQGNESGKGAGSEGKEKGAGDSKDSSAPRRDGESPRDHKEKRSASRPGKAEQGERNSNEAQQDSDSQPDPSSSPPIKVGSIIQKLGTIVKWIVFVLIGLVVLFLLLRNGLKYLANFMTWARDLLAMLQTWWDNFLGRSKSAAPEGGEMVSSPRTKPRIPFTSFSNPFADGTAEGRSEEELTVYSFHALEAWGGDHGAARRGDETPLEYSARLRREFPEIGEDPTRCAAILARLLYAPGPLPVNVREVLEAFWDTVTTIQVEGVEEAVPG